MDDDNFFAMPPAADDAGADAGAYDGGFTMIGGDAQGSPEPSPFMVGDVNEVAPSGGDDDFMGGYAPAPEADIGFAAAPAEDAAPAPIILGGPPPPSEDDMAPVPGEEGEENPPAVMVEDAPAAPPAVYEPSIMQKWNEEWQITLSERKDEENAKKAEMIEEAKAALAKFQADKEAKREAKMAKNREDEQAKLEGIEADLENDNSWQRVSKMVELTHDGAAEGAEDVKRMRDVLILLKNEPARAAAVGA